MTDLLRAAFDIGYRHIDAAVLYENATVIGKALKNIFSEGKYKRSDIYLVSKIFPIKN
jgi:diketogulonate reductase-like aldo/keto reductase